MRGSASDDRARALNWCAAPSSDPSEHRPTHPSARGSELNRHAQGLHFRPATRATDETPVCEGGVVNSQSIHAAGGSERDCGRVRRRGRQLVPCCSGSSQDEEGLGGGGGGRQHEQSRRPISAEGQRVIRTSETEHLGDLPRHVEALCPGNHEARAVRSCYGEKGTEPARRPRQSEDVDASALERSWQRRSHELPFALSFRVNPHRSGMSAAACDEGLPGGVGDCGNRDQRARTSSWRRRELACRRQLVPVRREPPRAGKDPSCTAFIREGKCSTSRLDRKGVCMSSERADGGGRNPRAAIVGRDEEWGSSRGDSLDGYRRPASGRLESRREGHRSWRQRGRKRSRTSESRLWHERRAARRY